MELFLCFARMACGKDFASSSNGSALVLKPKFAAKNW